MTLRLTGVKVRLTVGCLLVFSPIIGLSSNYDQPPLAAFFSILRHIKWTCHATPWFIWLDLFLEGRFREVPLQD